MIAITSDLYDIAGHMAAHNVIVEQGAQRRTSKVKTLDGALVVDDAGYFVGDDDRTFLVRKATGALVAAAQRLVALHTEHWLYDGGSVFKGVLRRYGYDPADGILQLVFTITEEF